MRTAQYKQAKRVCFVLWALTGLAVAAQIVAEESSVFGDYASIFSYGASVLVVVSLLTLGLLASVRRGLTSD